jgi:predicted RNA-binding Zn-ribbon protein involved in translation (DUF1610 family)
MSATLECPHCGHVESPLRHKLDSSCGGEIEWQYGSLRCEECGTKIILFRCNRCGRRLGRENVS